MAAMLASGLYTLTVVAVDGVAKMDSSFLVWLVPVQQDEDQ